jgi:hypothetical protein
LLAVVEGLDYLGLGPQLLRKGGERISDEGIAILRQRVAARETRNEPRQEAIHRNDLDPVHRNCSS